MNKSGKDWWHANQHKYPNSRSLDDLHASFQHNAKAFASILQSAKARVSISSTRRNEIRAYLMHYAWDVANELIDARDVPRKAGVDIIWDHNNKDLSIAAARDMVTLFNIAHRPSLKSNHIAGLAIDMNISWKGDLFLGPMPDGRYEGITEGPRNGARNRRMHEIGREFGVMKLLKDPPHWSYNGR